MGSHTEPGEVDVSFTLGRQDRKISAANYLALVYSLSVWLGAVERCSRCVLLEKATMSPFHQIYHIFTLRFSDDLCSSPVHLFSVSPPRADKSSDLPPSNSVPLEPILECQNSGTGMWSSCLALLSAKEL